MLALTKVKAFVDNKFIVAKMMIPGYDRKKTWWEKKKMLVNSIFSCSHNVFKRLLLQC